MNKNLLMILGFILLIILFVACDLGPYTVTFDSQGGASVSSQTVDKEGTVSRPDEPYSSSFSDKYFDGWYTKASGGEKWQFKSDIVTSVMTLYAHWKTATIGLTYDIINSTESRVIGSGTITGELVVPGYHDGLPVTAIGDDAFDGQTGITSAFVPSTIDTIGTTLEDGINASIFTGCTALAYITLRATTPPAMDGFFDFNPPSIETLFVPIGCKVIYDGDIIWGTYKTVTEESE